MPHVLKSNAKFEKKLICCFKNNKNLGNFDLSTPEFRLWLVPFVQNITDLWFGKWHEKFGKFSPEHLKVSKLGLWSDPFIQSRKCMSLKFREGLCVTTMQNDAKFKEKLTCCFKINIKNLTNFYSSTLDSLKILHFNGFLLTKVCNAWTKKVQRSSVWWYWGNLTMRPPFLHPPKKDFLFPSVWARRGYIIWTPKQKEDYWFVLKIVRVFPIPTGRLGVGWWKNL